MLTKFATGKRTYRSSTETGAVSDVVRLPASDKLPLRYKKTIKGIQSYLVDNEHRILRHFSNKKLTHTVELLDYQTHFNSFDSNGNRTTTQEITTVSAGVDIDYGGWLGTSINLTNQTQTYPDIFHHPYLLLTCLKVSLVALKQIHQSNVIHCDIKLDNICIPFDGENADKQGIIRPHLERLALIDFGHSHWQGNPIGSENRCWLGITNSNYRYQSKKLINILEQWQIDNQGRTEPPYDNRSLDNIDYSCDLYGLGFAFDSVLASLRRVDSELYRNEWSHVRLGLESVIKRLLEYDDGIPSHLLIRNLPHNTLIAELDQLISNAQSLLGYDCSRLDVQLIANISRSEVPDTPVVPATPILSKVIGNSSQNLDQEAWLVACKRDTKEGYEAYLSYYPQGDFASNARKRIEQYKNTDNSGNNESLKNKTGVKKLLIPLALALGVGTFAYVGLDDNEDIVESSIIDEENVNNSPEDILSEDKKLTGEEPSSKIIVEEKSDSENIITDDSESIAQTDEVESNDYSTFVTATVDPHLIDTSLCTETGVVTGLYMNNDNFLAVRKKPNSKGTLLDKIYANQLVYICDSVEGWHKIVYKKNGDCNEQNLKTNECKLGWSHSNYIQMTSDISLNNTSIDISSCTHTGYVSGLNRNGDNFLAVREEPNIKGSLLNKIHSAQQVYICDTSNDWYGIAYEQHGNCTELDLKSGNCQLGWSHSRYITINRE